MLVRVFVRSFVRVAVSACWWQRCCLCARVCMYVSMSSSECRHISLAVRMHVRVSVNACVDISVDMPGCMFCVLYSVVRLYTLVSLCVYMS